MARYFQVPEFPQHAWKDFRLLLCKYFLMKTVFWDDLQRQITVILHILGAIFPEYAGILQRF